MRDTAIESPCIRCCQISATHGICEGCGRTLAEIGGWLSLTPAERRSIVAELSSRLARLSEAP
ncbi:DUF1289 domain-containing protein [Phreatobacter sp.]|uniref:DUF1289 domain-containing protein n=1 Tax=Phreatobacter sp. TaxID=1966341 RepID=UPI003F6E908C